MSAPTLLHTYPADGDTGIPIGETLTLVFDKGIDQQVAKQMIVLYGAAYDTTSGPDNARWVNYNEDGVRPFFLRSPSFTGVVPFHLEFEYVDTTTYAPVSGGTITSETDEATAGIGHKVSIIPDNPLSADVTYTLFIYGDPDSTGDTGISARTVFDIEASPANTGLGEVFVYGSFEGSVLDTYNIVITKAGNIGEAEYTWYPTSGGTGSGKSGRLTARRYRRLENGLQVRFAGSAFAVGDSWTFNVEPLERMVVNTQISFTTNDGTFSTAPDSESTPAECEPPSSAFVTSGPGGTYGGSSFYVVETVPEERSFNVSATQDTIEIVFSDDVDPSTITNDTVRLWLYPADGIYDDTTDPVELSKSLTVTGNVVTIKI